MKKTKKLPKTKKVSKAKRSSKAKKLSVVFSNVTLQKEKARIGVKINRDDLELGAADALFCNAQLEVTLTCDPNSRGDVDGQQTMKGFILTVSLIAETKRYSVGSDVIAVSLSTPKSALDIKLLSQFAAAKGMMKCKRIGNAAAIGKDEEPEGEQE